MSLSQWDSQSDLIKAENHGFGAPLDESGLLDWQENELVPGVTYWEIDDELVAESDIMDYLISKGATVFDPTEF